MEVLAHSLEIERYKLEVVKVYMVTSGKWAWEGKGSKWYLIFLKVGASNAFIAIQIVKLEYNLHKNHLKSM